MNLVPETENNFRDNLATVSEEGKRKWIYPKKPKGKFHSARLIFSAILLIILFAAPFLKVNGKPLIMLNILERNFILFGVPFGPQDFYIFVLGFIGLIIFIVLFTAVFGRVFCGWACPQTVFMEMVFRKIEYFIEGNSFAQKKLKNEEWNASKLFKKSTKHFIFYSLSFIIANIFLAYIIGSEKLLHIISEPPSQHLEGLIAIIIFSGIFYFVFTFFREQACTIVCPYGRLQSVLLDQNSLIIAYDNFRGEPRGKLRKDELGKKGDCIDCHLCVDVCPTGIDIRNGLQLECVNCTACIDECNAVMTKLGRPENLIKYSSLNSISKNEKFKFTPRIVGYSILLLIIISVLTYLLATRAEYSVEILRTPGTLYQVQDEKNVSNIYDLNLVNKTFEDVDITLRLDKPDEGQIKIIGKPLRLKAQEKMDSKMLVILEHDELKKLNTEIKISVFANDKMLKQIKTNFMAPPKSMMEED